MQLAIQEQSIFEIQEREPAERSSDIFPLGPCNITLGSSSIQKTLEESEVTLSFEPITKDIKTDDSEELKKVLQTGEKVTFKCSIAYTKESASLFNLTGRNLALTFESPLKINSIDGNVTVELFNASIKLKTKHNFKKDKFHTISLEATGMKDFKNEIYDIQFN